MKSAIVSLLALCRVCALTPHCFFFIMGLLFGFNLEHFVDVAIMFFKVL
jgi:hypothetical protein